MITAVTMTRLERAATDNGFDLELAPTADWLVGGVAGFGVGDRIKAG